MARYIGDQNQTAFLYESGTYATASGTGHWIGLVTDFSPDEDISVQQVRYQGTGTRNTGQFISTQENFTGTMSYHPQDWKFLGFALGSNVDGGSPSPYTHTISEVNSASGNAFTSGALCPFMSFTLEHSQKGAATGLNFIRTFNGAMVNSMTLNIPEGDLISVDVDWIAQSDTFTSGAVTAVTAATTRPFVAGDTILTIPSGTSITTAKSHTLTINNNMVGPHYSNGSKTIGVPIPGNRDYEYSLTVDASSEFTKTFYDQYFLGGSTFNAQLQVTDAGAGAGSRDLFITFSGCKLTDMEAPGGMEEVNEQTITIMPKTVSALVNDTIELYNPW